MDKNMKKYSLIILVIVIIAGLIGAVVYNNQNRDNKLVKPLDISHVYTVEDFPEHNMDAETLQRFLDKINAEYDLLRQETDYDHYDIWVDIGNNKFALNDFVGAEEAWLQAIKLNPERPLVYANLANYYKDFVHDYTKADYYYDLAITKDNIGYFQDYQAYAELYINYLPEDSGKVETIILAGADKAANTSKIPFYYYLYKYFEGKDQTKVNYYRQQILDTDPNFDFSLYN